MERIRLPPPVRGAETDAHTCRTDANETRSEDELPGRGRQRDQATAMTLMERDLNAVYVFVL